MPRIRLGYVAMSLNLHDASPSGTVTLKTLSKLDTKQAKASKLKNTVVKNLVNTKRILTHNIAHHIDVYRFSSKLVPLATYFEEPPFSYSQCRTQFQEIGNLVLQHHLRVSFHPDHFTVLSTPSDEILEKNIKDLNHHHNMLNLMGLTDKKYALVLHLGGKYDSKEKAKQRFCDHFKRLPPAVSERIILENDDKVYHAEDVLEVCRHLQVPFVFDAHHHFCNGCSISFPKLLDDIFQTWDKTGFPPKIHFSTPKDGKNLRAHSNYIHTQSFLDFLDILKELGQDADIMLEAKAKDSALFRLLENIGQKKPSFDI